jgi:hypothetical protein
MNTEIEDILEIKQERSALPYKIFFFELFKTIIEIRFYKKDTKLPNLFTPVEPCKSDPVTAWICKMHEENATYEKERQEWEDKLNKEREVYSKNIKHECNI